jgi:hypothetical protein
MYPPKHAAAIGLYAILAVSLIPGMLAQKSEEPFHETFQEGCCLNRSFSRPEDVSRSQVSASKLREALHCSTDNRFIGGTRYLAKALGDQRSLHVAYYYGTYMPEQEGPALTIAVYSADAKHGVLFDVDWKGGKYYVENLPPLLRAPKQWRVGEINGGLWSYSRLWYLAQEIGLRPRISIPSADIERAKPQSCSVLLEIKRIGNLVRGNSSATPSVKQYPPIDRSKRRMLSTPLRISCHFTRWPLFAN